MIIIIIIIIIIILVMMMMVMMKINERGRLELLWRLLWDGTLSSEMAALKKNDAGEIDDTCACLKVGTH